MRIIESDIRRRGYQLAGLVLLFILVLCSVPALAQLPTATILGTVTDPSGAALANITVRATNLDQGMNAKYDHRRRRVLSVLRIAGREL